MADRWLSIRQAMQLAGVSRRTIYNWYTTGRLVTSRTAGGSLRIAPASVLRTETSPQRRTFPMNGHHHV